MEISDDVQQVLKNERNAAFLYLLDENWRPSDYICEEWNFHNPGHEVIALDVERISSLVDPFVDSRERAGQFEYRLRKARAEEARRIAANVLEFSAKQPHPIGAILGSQPVPRIRILEVIAKSNYMHYSEFYADIDPKAASNRNRQSVIRYHTRHLHRMGLVHCVAKGEDRKVRLTRFDEEAIREAGRTWTGHLHYENSCLAVARNLQKNGPISIESLRIMTPGPRRKQYTPHVFKDVIRLLGASGCLNDEYMLNGTLDACVGSTEGGRHFIHWLHETLQPSGFTANPGHEEIQTAVARRSTYRGERFSTETRLFSINPIAQASA
ncbi:MAG: hypothetical protein ABIA93_04575 [Candidatus Woesearchaeota archaeon]